MITDEQLAEMIIKYGGKCYCAHNDQCWQLDHNHADARQIIMKLIAEIRRLNKWDSRKIC